MSDLRQIYQMLFKHYGPQHWWPGDSPFEIMVGAVLTQNTAWTNVEKAIQNLKNANALTIEAITASSTEALATWLKPSGYFNVKEKRLRSLCQWIVSQGGEKELRTWDSKKLRDALLAVHGIGPETADDILLYAFGRPVFVIDTYTRRIFSRLGLITGDENYEHLRQLFESAMRADVETMNEFHALIVIHGKDVCRKSARCETCCLNETCRSAFSSQRNVEMS